MSFHLFSEKLSKQEILVQLKVFWKTKEPITMPKLAKNTNRFVAAGMFFELMGKYCAIVML